VKQLISDHISVSHISANHPRQITAILAIIIIIIIIIIITITYYYHINISLADWCTASKHLSPLIEYLIQIDFFQTDIKIFILVLRNAC